MALDTVIDAEKIILNSALTEFRHALADAQNKLAMANGKLAVADHVIATQAQEINDLSKLIEEVTEPPAS